MKETDIKTRLGLILQGVLRTALTSAKITFQEDYQYDSLCETPDFLIPDAANPQFVIEVHQTEARNSFQMKTTPHSPKKSPPDRSQMGIGKENYNGV